MVPLRWQRPIGGYDFAVDDITGIDTYVLVIRINKFEHHVSAKREMKEPLLFQCLLLPD